MGQCVGECHIGIRSSGNSERVGTPCQYRRGRDSHHRGLCEIGHDGGVAHEVIDFPVVEFTGRGGALNSHVAHHHNGSLSECPLVVGLAVGVAEAVVGTEIGGIVCHRHGGANAATQSYGPVEVFVPISAVAATDVADGTAVVVLAQKGLAEAGGGLELVGKAAIANHETELLGVGHGGDVGGGKVGSTPAGGTAVGGIVYPASALVVVTTHGGRIGRSTASDGDTRSDGDDGCIILEILHLRETLRGVDIVGGGIIHSRVGMSVAVVTRIATVDTCHEDSSVEEGGVVEGILLIHEGLFNLRSELADILSRETSAVAVRNIVARGPADIVEVGDMVG